MIIRPRRGRVHYRLEAPIMLKARWTLKLDFKGTSGALLEPASLALGPNHVLPVHRGALLGSARGHF